MRNCPRGLLLTAAVLLAACTTRVERVPDAGGSALAPALVVEQFLRAAATADRAPGVAEQRAALQRMGRLFGTAEGPIAERDPRTQVEQRMQVLARILRHRDFRVDSEETVAGRAGQAIRLTVLMQTDQRQVRVPFVVVRSKDGWLIEQIDIEALTAA